MAGGFWGLGELDFCAFSCFLSGKLAIVVPLKALAAARLALVHGLPGCPRGQLDCWFPSGVSGTWYITLHFSSSSSPFSSPSRPPAGLLGNVPSGQEGHLDSSLHCSGTLYRDSVEQQSRVWPIGITSIVSWPVPRKFSKLLRRGGIQSSKTESNERSVRKDTGSPRLGKRTPKAGMSRHDTENHG